MDAIANRRPLYQRAFVLQGLVVLLYQEKALEITPATRTAWEPSTFGLLRTPRHFDKPLE
jgi:hypothetical protein